MGKDGILRDQRQTAGRKHQITVVAVRTAEIAAAEKNGTRKIAGII